MSENELEVSADYSLEEKRPDISCYFTQALSLDLTITGDVATELYLPPDCGDTDLVVRITDMDKEGRSMKLTDSVFSVWYRNQFGHPDFMGPGQIYPTKIRTTKPFHAFCKGCCLRVTATPSTKNSISPSRNTRDSSNSVTTKTTHNRIHRDGAHVLRVVFKQGV